MFPRPGSARDASDPGKAQVEADVVVAVEPRRLVTNTARCKKAIFTNRDREHAQLFPPGYRSQLMSRARAREREQAIGKPRETMASLTAESGDCRGRAEQPERAADSSVMRLLRRYESLNHNAHPLYAVSRRAAKLAAGAADAASAAVVAERAVSDDKQRELARRKRDFEERYRLFCNPLPLAIIPAGDYSKPRSTRRKSEDLESLGLRLEETRDFFEGTVGRLRFFHACRDAMKLAETADDSVAIEGRGGDEAVWIARDFAQAAIRHGATPLPALLKQCSDGSLVLRGLGLSDGIVHALASVLPRLPHLKQLNLSENNIGDAALAAVTDVVKSRCPLIESLDLSHNTVGPMTAHSIRQLLSTGHRLRTLRLECADVDDNECAELVRSLAGNNSLTDLNLAQNLLGQTEVLNYACLAPAWRPNLFVGYSIESDCSVRRSRHRDGPRGNCRGTRARDRHLATPRLELEFHS